MSQLFTEFQPIAAIATTPTGATRLQSLCHSLNAALWLPESCQQPGAEIYHGSLKDHIAQLWPNHRAFIFCLATGAVVRLITPLLEDKSVDPAVVVVDEAGKFVISLCSGHQGGADRLTRLIAAQLGATPVITGAANALGYPGVDVLGVPFGWVRGAGDWTGVSATIARREPVAVMQEVGTTLWQEHLPEGHPFVIPAEKPPVVIPADNPPLPTPSDREESAKARIWISYTQRRFAPDAATPKVQWHPRVLWVGVGCERDTAKIVIETAIAQVFQANHLAVEAIAGLASIDIKADEVGLVELCHDRQWPLQTFPAEKLRSQSVPTPSQVVEQEVGTPSVAEAAAIAAANLHHNLNKNTGEETGRYKLASPFLRGTGGRSLLIPKQIFRLEGEPGAVTVAVAVADLEYTGRKGQLLLVGTGPGDLGQMTPAAQMSVTGADVVIGYHLYIDLIKPLLLRSQIVEALPITQERQRAQRAIELANWGLTVAVISSGDCGIYGMAGLVMEELRAQGWDGQVPGVQVFPGITALQALASRVGAPLMHDFCAISLSDLLTPWP
jgi:cobalt-precorrin 5A hydrolase/precorrin-3B C17-methyltransferase